MKKIILALFLIIIVTLLFIHVSKKKESIPAFTEQGTEEEPQIPTPVSSPSSTGTTVSDSSPYASTTTIKPVNTPTDAPTTPRTNATRTNAEWKKILTPAQYSVLRESGTEVPYTSALVHEKRAGTYVTADCGIPVFRSEQKFDSGTGWPSFWAPISAEAVKELKDTTEGEVRTEVRAKVCDSHLGHVFDDAPQTPTGLRYCINGVALKFIPD